MRSVCETKAFGRAAEEAGMSRIEVEALTDFIASAPTQATRCKGPAGAEK